MASCATSAVPAALLKTGGRVPWDPSSLATLSGRLILRGSLSASTEFPLPRPSHIWRGGQLALKGSADLSCRSNMRRAFRSSIWWQALVFLVCVFVIRWSAMATVSYTADVCKAAAHAREQPANLPSRSDANAHDTWLAGRKLLQIDDGPGKFAEAFADVLPSAAATAVIYGRYVSSAAASSQHEHRCILPE